MAVWYEVINNEKSISDFLDFNCSFHDYRLERIEYIPGKDLVEMFLIQDSLTEGVLLRFAWIKDVRIYTKKDYDVDWIFSCSLIIADEGAMIFADSDNWDLKNKEDLEKCRKNATVVEFERLMWAITDAIGSPIEMPEDKIRMIRGKGYKSSGLEYEFEEFTDDFEKVLKPWYLRQ